MIPSQWQPLAYHLWQSTVFACAAALLTLALKKNRAAVRHGLWVAASVKFLVPLALLITVGSELAGQMAWRKPPVAVRPQIAVAARISEPFAVQAPVPAMPPAPRGPSRIPAVLFGLWLCGFAANCLAWWRGWRRLRAGSPIVLGIFGAFRPRLLLPEGITERLTPAQFQAVIAHELCHVRRRDNLTAAIHMMVEALFWFHPLVWWIEARLVEERERACDEEVLRRGHDPQDYAEGIVNVAKLYLESPLVCVAGVTGGRLTRRVEAIMLNRGTRRLGLARGLLVASAGLVAVGVPVALGILGPAPLRAAGLSFETATILSINPVDGMIRATPQILADGTPLGPTKLGAISGTQFAMPIGTVKSLIMDAYSAKDIQIEGLPAWAAGSEFYSINAQAAGDVPPAPEQVRVMLQSLLAARFRLRVRGETRDVPVYELRIAEGGSKVKAAPRGGAPWWFVLGTLRLFLDRPVVDKTGFTGVVDARPLDFKKWTKGQGLGSPAPSVFREVEERLGLTLKAASQRADFIVVENVERPRADYR